MKFIPLLCSFLSALVIYSCGNSSNQKSVEVKSAGQSLYETYCTSCHGEDGKLCVLGAKDLSLSTFSKEQMEEIITNGKNTMTPFSNVLNKEEVGAVADYVQTLKAK